MCRVILSSYADFMLYDKKYGVLNLMDRLEKELGGHGNGYVLSLNGKILDSRKGKTLTNKEIYTIVTRIHKKWDFIVWHTRIASIGNKADSNNHPFIDITTSSAMAMNGSEHALIDIADAFHCTDTEIIFRNTLGKTVQEVTQALVEFNSVFVGLAYGKPYAVNAAGNLSVWKQGDRTFHASTFAKNIKNTEILPDGYIWADGVNTQFLKNNARAKDRWTGLYDYPHDYSFEDDYEEGYVTGFKDGLKRREKLGKELKAKVKNPASEYNVGFYDGEAEGYGKGYTEGLLAANNPLRNIDIDTSEYPWK